MKKKVKQLFIWDPGKGIMFHRVIEKPKPYTDHKGRRFIFKGETRYPVKGEYYQQEIMDQEVVKSDWEIDLPFNRKIMIPLDVVDDSARFLDYDKTTMLFGTQSQLKRYISKYLINAGSINNLAFNIHSQLVNGWIEDQSIISVGTQKLFSRYDQLFEC